MRAFKDKNLEERLQNAAQAKQALLQKFNARPGPDDPVVKKRHAKRQAIAAAREARARARERESARVRAEQERAELEVREEAERAAIRERELQDHMAHEAAQKAENVAQKYWP